MIEQARANRVTASSNAAGNESKLNMLLSRTASASYFEDNDLKVDKVEFVSTSHGGRF